MKTIVLTLLILTTPLIADDALPVTVAPKAVAADRFLEDAAKFGFAGQVVIAVDGEVILHKAYGFADRAARRRVTPSTTFGIASMSKMFTAAAILKAQEEKLLSIDDPIAKYLPNTPPERAAITIAQLLTHTSGVGAGFTNDFEDPSVAAVVERVLKHEPMGTPGSAWRYASEGYVLLAAILEKATGRSYDDYVREKLFKPAGMKTAWFVGEHDPFHTAPSHAYNGLRDNGSPASWPLNARYVGAGSIVASASDLYRWASALWGRRVLSSESTAAMLSKHASPGKVDDDFGYGMFLWKTENGAYAEEHGGDTAVGFNGLVRFYPAAKTILVITCNVMNIGGASYRSAVQPAFTAWLETGKPTVSDGVDWIAPSRAASLVGTYDGAEIVYDGANAWLAIESQELLDAARKHTPEQRAIFADDNRKTAALLGAMRERKVDAQSEMLDDWNKAIATNGALLDFKVLGTTAQGKTTRTFARLRFVDGDATMVFRWGNEGKGPLVAWNPNAQRYPMLVALAAKGSAFVARDLLGDRGPWRVTNSARGLVIEIPEPKALGERSVAEWMR